MDIGHGRGLQAPVTETVGGRQGEEFLNIKKGNPRISLMVQRLTSPFNTEGVTLIPGQEANIPHDSGPKSQNTKQKK